MTTRRLLPVAVFVLLLATLLRFHLLEAQSFWNDEGNSARLSERPVAAIIEGTASDIHPPLYYLALRGWRELVGETEFGLRSLSAFAGVLVVAVVIALGRWEREKGRRGEGEKGSRGEGVGPAVAGLLATVSPVLVYYSQETRMYALLALTAVLSGWVLLVWLGGTRRPFLWMAAYTLLLAVGLYTHYFFPAVVVAQGVVVVIGRKGEREKGRREDWVRLLLVWAGMAAVAGMLYLPWVPVFLRQIGGRGAAAGPVAFVVESARWLALGITTRPDEGVWAVITYALLVLMGLVTGGRRAVTCGLLAFVPLLLMFLVGATDPAFFKFMLAVVPFLAVIAGGFGTYESKAKVEGFGWREVLLVVWAGLTVAVIAGSLLSLGNMYGDPAFARADYRGMAARISAEGHPNAGIILVAPNQWEAFTYYYRNGAPVYPLPRGRPDPAIVEPELEEIAAAHDRLYALYWGDAQRDPERIVERWLDANTFKVSEEWVGDVRFVVYAVPQEAPAAMTQSGATFAGLDGESITLESFTVWPKVARPGDVVQVQLVWSADRTPARSYKIFLHLLDSAGNLVAQRDGEPGGGLRPTTGWEPGEQVTDNHGLLLPLDLPPGVYSLRLGLYDAFDPAVRLAVGGGDGVVFGELTIKD